MEKKNSKIFLMTINLNNPYNYKDEEIYRFALGICFLKKKQ